mmetsp:Transcript_16912/g.34159  ORF Transcript_16912/g.34159 Transcript_16912/m.34159 type:complete len:95 (+) Transcript_16912:1108-1392(+)
MRPHMATVQLAAHSAWCSCCMKAPDAQFGLLRGAARAHRLGAKAQRLRAAGQGPAECYTALHFWDQTHRLVNQSVNKPFCTAPSLLHGTRWWWV